MTTNTTPNRATFKTALQQRGWFFHSEASNTTNRPSTHTFLDSGIAVLSRTSDYITSYELLAHDLIHAEGRVSFCENFPRIYGRLPSKNPPPLALVYRAAVALGLPRPELAEDPEEVMQLIMPAATTSFSSDTIKLPDVIVPRGPIKVVLPNEEPPLSDIVRCARQEAVTTLANMAEVFAAQVSEGNDFQRCTIQLDWDYGEDVPADTEELKKDVRVVQELYETFGINQSDLACLALVAADNGKLGMHTPFSCTGVWIERMRELAIHTIRRLEETRPLRGSKPWSKIIDLNIYYSGSLRGPGMQRGTACDNCFGKKRSQDTCHVCGGLGATYRGRRYWPWFLMRGDGTCHDSDMEFMRPIVQYLKLKIPTLAYMEPKQPLSAIEEHLAQGQCMDAIKVLLNVCSVRLVPATRPGGLYMRPDQLERVQMPDSWTTFFLSVIDAHKKHNGVCEWASPTHRRPWSSPAGEDSVMDLEESKRTRAMRSLTARKAKSAHAVTEAEMMERLGELFVHPSMVQCESERDGKDFGGLTTLKHQAQEYLDKGVVRISRFGDPLQRCQAVEALLRTLQAYMNISVTHLAVAISTGNTTVVVRGDPDSRFCHMRQPKPTDVWPHKATAPRPSTHGKGPTTGSYHRARAIRFVIRRQERQIWQLCWDPDCHTKCVQVAKLDFSSVTCSAECKRVFALLCPQELLKDMATHAPVTTAQMTSASPMPSLRRSPSLHSDWCDIAKQSLQLTPALGAEWKRKGGRSNKPRLAGRIETNVLVPSTPNVRQKPSSKSSAKVELTPINAYVYRAPVDKERWDQGMSLMKEAQKRQRVRNMSFASPPLKPKNHNMTTTPTATPLLPPPMALAEMAPPTTYEEITAMEAEFRPLLPSVKTRHIRMLADITKVDESTTNTEEDTTDLLYHLPRMKRPRIASTLAPLPSVAEMITHEPPPAIRKQKEHKRFIRDLA